jgi:transposase
MRPNFSDELLRQAAVLRAGGRSWDAVAADLKRSVGTVREWPRKFRVRWRQLMSEAVAEQNRASVVESQTALRKLLRTKDAKVVQSAATSLLRTAPKPAKRSRSRAKPTRIPAATLKLAAYVEGLSDAELDAHLHELDGADRTDGIPAGPDDAAADAIDSPRTA